MQQGIPLSPARVPPCKGSTEGRLRCVHRFTDLNGRCQNQKDVKSNGDWNDLLSPRKHDLKTGSVSSVKRLPVDVIAKLKKMLEILESHGNTSFKMAWNR